ncbi:hypothetical protein [Paenibacillus sp. WLX2291]|uniref:hypothetical protein n=1 Tax=Paenibacillus sp. WLX2291 TaxID=3296934 RepID=UPI003983E4F2
MVEESIQLLLHQIEQLTSNVLITLHEMSEEQFEQFSIQREELIKELEMHRMYINKEHRIQIKKILDNDPIILQRMTFLKEEAGQWLEKKTAVRTQHNAYQHAYTLDSVFVDHRK